MFNLWPNYGNITIITALNGSKFCPVVGITFVASSEEQIPSECVSAFCVVKINESWLVLALNEE